MRISIVTLGLIVASIGTAMVCLVMAALNQHARQNLQARPALPETPMTPVTWTNWEVNTTHAGLGPFRTTNRPDCQPDFCEFRLNDGRVVVISGPYSCIQQ